jgi:hypothetical protein
MIRCTYLQVISFWYRTVLWTAKANHSARLHVAWELSDADLFKCHAQATTAIVGIFQQSSQVTQFIW